jgi:hypothetical protein
MVKRKKDKQWSTNRRTDNTMVKRKSTNNDLQNITQKVYCLSFCVMFCRSLFVLFSFDHCIVCPSVCRSLFVHNDLQTEGQTIQWPKERVQTTIYKTLHRRTDNTMAKRKSTNNDLQNITQKDRQYNGQKKEYKQWSIKHYTEGQTIQVLFLLAIVLSVLLFVDHCLYSFFWSLYCLSFCL